jgi:hypothetical protein
MKKPVRKKTKTKPLWMYEHQGVKYPVSAEKTKQMFDMLHDEVLICGNQSVTMFLYDMMETFRNDKDLIAMWKKRHPWMYRKQPNRKARNGKH